MLKIKDDVDLKVLEKYGFEYNKMFTSNKIEVPGQYVKNFEYEFITYGYIIDAELRDIMILVDNRGIDDDNMREFDTLYDLIQDGLVEKVE